MSAEVEKDEERHPHAGFVFEDIAEVVLAVPSAANSYYPPLSLLPSPLPQQEEFSAYCTYASNYMYAVVKLEELFEDPVVVEYLKVGRDGRGGGGWKG